MCDPVSAGLGLAAVIGSTMMQPDVPAPQAPTAIEAPQASKAPSAAGVAAGQAGTGQAGGAPGVAQTFLAGATGVDPSKLTLGKSTLLGQ